MKRLTQRKYRKARNIIEFDNSIRDIFSDDTVQSMKEISHHMNCSCLEHSLFVSYLSYRFCKWMKWDYVSAARGGLLHDLFLYDWKTKDSHEGLHGFTHPEAAYKNAEELCRVKQDTDLLNTLEKDIILKHMWPLTKKKPSFKESFVVCLMDKICALAEMTFIFGVLPFKSRIFTLLPKAI